MSNIVEADYKVMQERTLPIIASEILQIEENVGRVALDGAIRIGKRLQEAKEQVEHGKWESWCKDNLNYSKSKTEKLMKIASEYGDNSSEYSKAYICTDLSISKALALLQVPEDEVKEFAESTPVEDITVEELKEEIKTWQGRAERAREELEDSTRREGDLTVCVSDLTKERESLKEELAKLRETGGDPEQTKELEDKIAKLEKQNQTLKDKAKAEKQKKDAEIEKAVAAERDKIKAEAEAAAAEKTQAAEGRAQELEKKVAQLESGESLLLFKLKVDELQEVYKECLEAAKACPDPCKTEAALQAVVKAL